MRVVNVESECRRANHGLPRSRRGFVRLHHQAGLPSAVHSDADALSSWMRDGLSQPEGVIHLHAGSDGAGPGGEVRVLVGFGGPARVFSATVARPDLGRPRVTPQPGLRVLLVDDDLGSRLLTRRILESAGCEVTEAEDGLMGLDRAEMAPDLVLLDMQMPRLEGPEVARRLRARHFQAPILALTANAMPEDRAECIGAGMNDALVKPVKRADLLEIVAGWAGVADSAGV